MELTEVVGQLQAKVNEVVKLGIPKSEADERFKKIEDVFTELQESVKEQKHRLTALPAPEVGGGAGHWLAKSGYSSVNAAARLQLFDVNGKGQVVDRRLAPEEVEHALKTMDEVYIADHLMFRKRGDEWLETKKEMGERAAFIKHFPELGLRHDATIEGMARAQGKTVEEFLKKTLTTGGTATGAEWIPTTFTSQLLAFIRLENPETNIIPHFNMPASPYVFPFQDPVGQAYRKIENVAVTESTPGTGNRTWTAHMHAVYHTVTDEMNEDSIVAAAPALRASLIRSMGEGLSMGIVNGDNDAASHIDDDYQTGAAPFFTYQGGFNGLRQFALDPQGSGSASSLDGSAAFIGFQMVADAMAQMGKFAAGKAGELVLLVNAESWLRLMGEASSPIVTLDKYGTQASILSGEVARIFGVPVMVSFAVEQRRNSVASTGMNDATGNTLSTAVLFNRNNFKIGDRRMFRFETDRNIVTMQDQIVSSARWAMNSVEGNVADANWNPAGTPAVVAIININ